MESDLTKKLPIREHIKNIKKILNVIYQMNHAYFFLASIVHMINVGIPYLGLILSAYIL